MCCARTAALQGRDEKQKANASRVLLQQIWHNLEKCPKTGLRQAMTGPRWSQDRPKRGSNRPRQTQDWAKTGPRQAKTGTKSEFGTIFGESECLKTLVFAMGSPCVRDFTRKVPKEQKMCQHGLNMRRFRFGFGRTLASPSKEKQYVNASQKCSGT